MTKVVSVQLGHFIFFTFDSKLLRIRPMAANGMLGTLEGQGNTHGHSRSPKTTQKVRRQFLYLGMITLSIT